jgi:hypothetical protein
VDKEPLTTTARPEVLPNNQNSNAPIEVQAVPDTSCQQPAQHNTAEHNCELCLLSLLMLLSQHVGIEQV